MATQNEKYKQAALTYLIYGIIYLAGAIVIAQSGVSAKTMRPNSGLVYFIIGALVVIGFPLLISKRYKWFTRILALLVLYKVYEIVKVLINDIGKSVPLPWGGEISMFTGGVIFLVLAAITCVMLARAGWDIGETSRFK